MYAVNFFSGSLLKFYKLLKIKKSLDITILNKLYE
jgi:hypothetical protein